MTRINELIVIGGLSCAGKSFLISKIKKGNCVGLCAQLGIAVPAAWRYALIKEVGLIEQSTIERLIVHYDFHAQYKQEDGYKYLHELIGCSDNVTIVTLCAFPEMLIQRNTLRFRRSIALLFSDPAAYRQKFRRLRRLWRIRKEYADHSRVFDAYERWFDVFKECRVKRHWLLDCNEPGIPLAYPYETDKARIFSKVVSVAGR